MAEDVFLDLRTIVLGQNFTLPANIVIFSSILVPKIDVRAEWVGANSPQQQFNSTAALCRSILCCSPNKSKSLFSFYWQPEDRAGTCCTGPLAGPTWATLSNCNASPAPRNKQVFWASPVSAGDQGQKMFLKVWVFSSHNLCSSSLTQYGPKIGFSPAGLFCTHRSLLYFTVW